MDLPEHDFVRITDQARGSASADFPAHSRLRRSFVSPGHQFQLPGELFAGHVEGLSFHLLSPAVSVP